MVGLLNLKFVDKLEQVTWLLLRMSRSYFVVWNNHADDGYSRPWLEIKAFRYSSLNVLM